MDFDKLTNALTDKQKLFVENYLITGNVVKAAELAGYTPTSAYDLVKKSAIRHVLRHYIDHTGLDDSFILRTIKDGLTATKIHGTSDDFVETPDHAVRHKYLETLIKLKDMTSPDRIEHSAEETFMTFLQGVMNKAQQIDNNSDTNEKKTAET